MKFAFAFFVLGVFCTFQSQAQDNTAAKTLSSMNTRLGYQTSDTLPPSRNDSAIRKMADENASLGYRTDDACLDAIENNEGLLGTGSNIDYSNSQAILMETKNDGKHVPVVTIYSANGAATITGTTCGGASKDSNFSKEISKRLANVKSAQSEMADDFDSQISDKKFEITALQKKMKPGLLTAATNGIQSDLTRKNAELKVLQNQKQKANSDLIETLRTCANGSDPVIAEGAKKGLKDLGVSAGSASNSGAPGKGAK